MSDTELEGFFDAEEPALAGGPVSEDIPRWRTPGKKRLLDCAGLCRLVQFLVVEHSFNADRNTSTTAPDDAAALRNFPPHPPHHQELPGAGSGGNGLDQRPCIVPAIVGVWLPIRERSDSYAPILAEMGIGWLGRKMAESLTITSELYYTEDEFHVLGSSVLGDSLDRFLLTGEARQKLINEPVGTPVLHDVWQRYINRPPRDDTVATITSTFRGDPMDAIAGKVSIVVISERRILTYDETAGEMGVEEICHERVTLKKYRSHQSNENSNGYLARAPPLQSWFSRRENTTARGENLVDEENKNGEEAGIAKEVVINRYMRRAPGVQKRPLPPKLAASWRRSRRGSRGRSTEVGRRVGNDIGCQFRMTDADLKLLDTLGTRMFRFLQLQGNSEEEISSKIVESDFVSTWDTIVRGSNLEQATAMMVTSPLTATKARDNRVGSTSFTAISRAELRETLSLWFRIWGGHRVQPGTVPPSRNTIATGELRRLARAILLLRRLSSVCFDPLPANKLRVIMAKMTGLGKACGNLVAFSDFFSFVEQDEKLLESFHFVIHRPPKLQGQGAIKTGASSAQRGGGATVHRREREVSCSCCGIIGR